MKLHARTLQPETNLERAALRRRWLAEALQRQGRRCFWCGAPIGLQANSNQQLATCDHAIPLGKRGVDQPANVVAACGPCNSSKGDAMPWQYVRRLVAEAVAADRAAQAAVRRAAPRARRPLDWLGNAPMWIPGSIGQWLRGRLREGGWWQAPGDRW